MLFGRKTWMLLLLIPFIVQAQHPVPILTKLRPNGTLPAPENVRSFYQDSLGFVWSGNILNVTRFDGAQYVSPVRWHFPDREVERYFTGPEGQPTYLSQEGNLYMIEQDTVRSWQHNGLISKLMLNGNVGSLLFDDNRTLHAGLIGTGYLTIDSTGNVDTVCAASSGLNGLLAMRLPSNDKPFIFSIGARSSTSISWLDTDLEPLVKTEIDETGITAKPSLAEASDGTIYILTGHQEVWTIHPNLQTTLKTFPFRVTHIFIDDHETLWLGTEKHGIRYFSNRNLDEENERVILEGVSGHVDMMDHANELWIATEKESYVLQLNGHTYYPHGKSPLPEGSGVGICTDGKVVYVTSGNGGILKLHQNEFEPIEGPFDHPEFGSDVSYLHYQAETKELWAGGHGQLAVRRTNQAWSSIDFPDSLSNEAVRVIRTLNSGQMLVLLNHRFLLFDDTTLVFTSGEMDDRIINGRDDEHGNLFLATLGGIFSVEDGKLISMKTRDPWLGKAVADIYFDDSTMLAALANFHLSVVTSDSIYKLLEEDRLYVRVLYLKEYGDGRLMSLGSRGMTLLSMDGPNVTRTHHPINETASFVHRNGYIAVGDTVFMSAIEGLYVIPKKEFERPHTFPIVRATAISINGRDTTVHSHYDLRHDQNAIEVEYTGILYGHFIKRPNFEYRMVGLEEDLTYNGNDYKVRYTSLDPGDYTLEIYARTGYEMWGDPRRISFTIHPPFWQTWWFRSLLVLALLLLVLAIVLLYAQQIRKNEQEKSKIALEISRLELRAIKAQLNPHFIFNAISSVMYYLSENKAQEARKYLERFAQLIRSVLDSSEKSVIPLEDELLLMTHYIHLESDRFEEGRITLEVNTNDLKASEILIPPLLFQPYIENAIWHGLQPKNGERRIMLDFRAENHQLYIAIEDNGIGRKKARNSQRKHQFKRSYGMTIASRRIEAANGSAEEAVHIEDLLDSDGNPTGTRVTFSIPVIQKKRPKNRKE